MPRRAGFGWLPAALLALAACQGGGKFQVTEPDAVADDGTGGDVPVDVLDQGPTDRGPDAAPACTVGDGSTTCQDWGATLGACRKARCNQALGQCEAYDESDGVDCDDGDACTTGETCTKGACGGGQALSCDDGFDCTADSCDPAGGCVHAPDDGACDDGDPCTGVERCDLEEGCVTGPVAGDDPTCDGVDDDCDGTTDDDFVGDDACLAAGCGVGGHPSTCTDGVEAPCQAATVAADDATCDGVDDDCSGETDEDYEVVALCGTGACADAATASSCADGVETPCTPGEAAADDASCNASDDDCDGSTDEDYVRVSNCGVGVCAKDTVPSSCTNGHETACVPGAPEALVDTTCNGRDDDCDGSYDEDYVAVTVCGSGPCRASATPSFCLNGFEVACQPGIPPSAKDASCNGVDDDCDGATDDDYAPVAACGTGPCRDASTPSTCVEGKETACRPGDPPSETDATCDKVDDDCNGATDEDYVPVTECGLGPCRDAATPSRCDAGVVTPCRPGTPAPDDATCNAVDDDCNGDPDDGTCVIDGSCVDAGAADPADPCQRCDPGTLRTGWSSGEGLACDDGRAWTTDDACTDHVCAGTLAACFAELSFGDALRARSLVVPPDGRPGNGLDVDEDAATCAPSGQDGDGQPLCSDGIDNQFSRAADVVNPALADRLDTGALHLVMEFGDLAQDPFPIHLHLGRPDPAGGACDFTQPGCPFLADASGYDGTCRPVYSLDNGHLDGDRVIAGGLGYDLGLVLPLWQTAWVTVTVHDARLDGLLARDAGGATGFVGLLAGAVDRLELQDALGDIPQSDLPLPKDEALALLDLLLPADLDTDGDDQPDSISLGIRAVGQAALLTGVFER